MKWKLLLMASIPFFACRRDGATILIERKLEDFTSVRLEDKIDLVLQQDTANFVRIEAGESMADAIQTVNENGLLRISNPKAGLIASPSIKAKVYLHFKTLQSLYYEGSGEVRNIDTLKCPYFTLVSNFGAGTVSLTLTSYMITSGIYNDNADFILKGASDSCYTYCSTRGTIDYRDLVVKRMELDYSGVRDAFVQAQETFTGRIAYKGNVYYRGNPSLRLRSSNEGKFIPF